MEAVSSLNHNQVWVCKNCGAASYKRVDLELDCYLNSVCLYADQIKVVDGRVFVIPPKAMIHPNKIKPLDNPIES